MTIIQDLIAIISVTKNVYIC